MFLGTPKDNAIDRESKGRGAIGIKNGLSKLSEIIVLQIRKLHGDGKSKYALAKSFGVHPKTITYIVERKTWKHI